MRSDRATIVELVILATTAAAIGLLLDGILLWVAAAGLAAATAFGAFAFLYEHEPRGVPIESLAGSVVAAVAMLGLAHLAGIAPTLLPALLAGAALLAGSLVMERRMLGPYDGDAGRHRNQLVQLTVLLSFAGFIAVAGAVPGGLAQARSTAGEAAPQIAAGSFALLAAGDAVIAFLLGYRLAALRTTSARQAAWAGGTFAGLVAVAALAVRAVALSALIGPAVLTVVFYLWAAYRAAPGSERRSASWLWEYGLIAIAAAVLAAWNLLVR